MEGTTVGMYQAERLAQRERITGQLSSSDISPGVPRRGEGGGDASFLSPLRRLSFCLCPRSFWTSTKAVVVRAPLPPDSHVITAVEF
ncbi:hypothetical protein Ptr902_09069 [Pyrenophora tritici-repentis]|nr:hypothetical protein Ptr902_09069 [Pyrenophora tritici-repentis]